MQGFWNLLSGDEQEALSGLGMRRDYTPSATICLEGDPATQMFVLLAGWVKILSTTKDGQQIVLALRGDGDIVGEIGGETGRRNATIKAIDTVKALIVRYDRFRSFLDSVVTQRWNDADTILRSRTGTSGAQRLAGLLLDFANRRGQGVDGVIHLVLPLTQEELASLAGTSRATVTRALSNWRKRGFVLTAQRHITIIDLNGLRQAAGQQR
jgi:CRP/FNR family cyclic AMP-dependent transcriptional regulator